MLLIGVSFVSIILGKGTTIQKLLVSGFLITQSILGRCIVTTIENQIRVQNGFSATSNEFILHNLVGSNTTIYRILFFIIGGFLLGTVIGETIGKLETKRTTEKVL